MTDLVGIRESKLIVGIIPRWIDQSRAELDTWEVGAEVSVSGELRAPRSRRGVLEGECSAMAPVLWKNIDELGSVG
jgi:hypothetical protein